MSRGNFVDSWRTRVWNATKDQLSATEKLVALAHSKYANYESGGSCHPGAARIARDTSLSERSVITIRTSLEAKGWMVCTAGNRGGTRKGDTRMATVYQLTLPVDIVARTGEAASPVPARTGEAASTTGETDAADRVSSFTPPSVNSSVPACRTAEALSPVPCDKGWFYSDAGMVRCVTHLGGQRRAS